MDDLSMGAEYLAEDAWPPEPKEFISFRNHLQRAKNNLKLALKCKEMEIPGMTPLKERIINMRNNLDILILAADKTIKRK